MYRKFYGYAIEAGRIGVIGIIAAILLRIALFYSNGWLHAVCGVLHAAGLLAFFIGIPAMFVFSTIAAIYYFGEGKK